MVVHEGKVLAEGYHRRVGVPHAEVEALKRLSGKLPSGAILYVNLEPCDHHGRTPPCTDLLLKSGLQRVVVGMIDPNPRVRGRGVRRLREAGVDVTVGVLREKCYRLNESYAKWIRRGIPFVTLKMAASLDGGIAAADGSSRWVTGPLARQKVHRLRSEVDAVLVGVGTVLKDDPYLTTRPLRSAHQPVRVILDTHLRIPERSRLVRGASQVPVWVVCGVKIVTSKVQRLKDRGVRIIPVISKQGEVLWRPLLKRLGAEGITNLLVEGGGEVASSALGAGVVDKLLYFVAPKLFGGKGTLSSFPKWGVRNIRQALELEEICVEKIGEDYLFEGYLKR